ncbi:MAG: hypothetical protein HGA75_09885 [Thiobacillus sp.]|nr:hypothetical protein [Thiobacillus sp.]
MKMLFLRIVAVSFAWAMFTVPSFGQGNDKAIVVLDSPEVMKIWNNKYRWDATFRETGGKSGYEVRSTDFYILAPDGGKWINDWSETHKVRAGGSTDVNYFIDVSDKWAGGKFHCIWEGKDEGGNAIRIVQEVQIPK